MSSWFHWTTLVVLFVLILLFYRFCKSSDEMKKQKVIQILDKLIALTIQEVEMYPSIQAKIWGGIGKVSFECVLRVYWFQSALLWIGKCCGGVVAGCSSYFCVFLKVSDLIDTVLECFLKRCAEVRIGSPVVEILADTAVALASANVRLVAIKIISRLCSVSCEELWWKDGAAKLIDSTPDCSSAFFGAGGKLPAPLSWYLKRSLKNFQFQFSQIKTVTPSGFAPDLWEL